MRDGSVKSPGWKPPSRQPSRSSGPCARPPPRAASPSSACPTCATPPQEPQNDAATRRTTTPPNLSADAASYESSYRGPQVVTLRAVRIRSRSSHDSKPTCPVTVDDHHEPGKFASRFAHRNRRTGWASSSRAVTLASSGSRCRVPSAPTNSRKNWRSAPHPCSTAATAIALPVLSDPAPGQKY